jgi:hypothetical protein
MYEVNLIHDEYDYPLKLGSLITPQSVNSNKYFARFLVLYFVVNFLVSTLLNSLIEICFLYTLRRDLRKKETIMSGLNEAALNVKNKVNDKARCNALKMITINSLLNFFLRLPECITLFYFVFWSFEDMYDTSPLNQLCFEAFTLFLEFNQFCSNVIDLFDLFYILTFTTNLIIFYAFNRQFRESFKNAI